MSQLLTTPAAQQAQLPGAAILRGVRRTMILGLSLSILYSVLATATTATCPGGGDASGGYVDPDGNPTDVVPSCITLVMGPNPLVFVIFALIAIGAVSSAVRKSTTETDALRYLSSAAIVMAAITAVCLVAGHIWFWDIPVMDWRVGDAPFVTSPFVTLTTTITPMSS